MTLRKIASVGHPILREKSRDVSVEELRSSVTQTLIDDLIETMRDANGAGLAAPQVYENVRIVVVEVNKNPRYPYKPSIPLTVLVNPKITPLNDETFENYEGCLSVPNLRGRVTRHAMILINALDRFAQPLKFEVRGVSAGVYQHEVDHLDATLFIDRVRDPGTFATWTEFERFHMNEYVEYAKVIVDRYGSLAVFALR